jgi:hypothetical protein
MSRRPRRLHPPPDRRGDSTGGDGEEQRALRRGAGEGRNGMVDGGGVLVSWLAAGAAVPAGRRGSGAALPLPAGRGVGCIFFPFFPPRDMWPGRLAVIPPSLPGEIKFIKAMFRL